MFLAITYMDLATTFPFENTIDTFDLQGVHVKELFEFAAKSFTSNDKRSFMQVSGKIQQFLVNAHINTSWQKYTELILIVQIIDNF